MGMLWRLAFDEPSPSSGGGAGAAFDDTVLGKSPSGYWLAGSSDTTVADEVGSVDFTWSGTPVVGVSSIDGTSSAATLDGSTDYLSRNDDDIFDCGTSDFSLMAAIKVSAWPSANHYTIFGHNGGGGSNDLGLFLNRFATDVVSLYIDGTSYNMTSPVTLADDAWHLLIVAADRSGNATLWVDDQTGATVSISAESATSLTNANVALIGTRDPTHLDKFTGSLDKVAIWNSTLLTSGDRDDIFAAISAPPPGDTDTDAEVYAAAIMDFDPVAYFKMDEASGTQLTDSSSNANHGAYSGSPTLGASGPIAGATAVTFSAALSQYASAPHISDYNLGSGSWTLIFWINVPSWPASSQFAVAHGGNNASGEWEAYLTSTTDTLNSRMPTTGNCLSSGISGFAGSWHMVALVCDRTADLMRWYVDAVAKGTTDISSSTTALDYTSPLYIARRNAGSYLGGSMCQVALIKSLLDSTDISDLYTASGV